MDHRIQVNFDVDHEGTLRVYFTYWLENNPNKKHTKTLSFFQRYKLKKIDVDKIESFIRFLLIKKAITPEFLFYQNSHHIRAMIMKNLTLMGRETVNLNKSREIFREFMDLYNEKGVDGFPMLPKVVKVDNGEGKIENIIPQKLKNPEDVSVYPKGGLLEVDRQNPNTGRSTLILGASFSGKTHLLVDSLNQLHPSDYEMILFFTESKNAEPLKNIKSDLPIKVYEGWQPKKVEFLKKINDILQNRFRFLVILDDIVDQKLSKTLNKLILTYRNANISTCILIQYPNLISKSSRSSFHQCVIVGSRSIEWWDSTCKVFDLREWAREEFKNVISPHNRLKITNPEIYTFLKKSTKKLGSIIYIDLRKGKEPLLCYV
jgi:hypothetical protein